MSHIKASPAGFAKILTQSEFYKDFRFDVSPNIKVEVSKPEKDRIAKRQDELDSFYQDVEKASRKGGNDIESRSAVYKENSDQSKLGMSMYSENFALKKDNIKIITVYDPQDNRYIICEKTYEL